MVALIQALVITIQNENDYPNTHIQILESNKWQAVRYGLEGVFVDPITFQKYTMRSAIENLCKLIEPNMTSLVLTKYIKIIENILKKGTGSITQRKLYDRSGRFEYMIQSLKE